MPGDCCECGACCFSDSDAYVPVTEDDIRRMGGFADQAVSVVEGRSYLRMEAGHCAQLQHVEGNWVCGVYPVRPLACRELERGSVPCLEERAVKLILARQLTRRLLRVTAQDTR